MACSWSRGRGGPRARCSVDVLRARRLHAADLLLSRLALALDLLGSPADPPGDVAPHRALDVADELLLVRIGARGGRLRAARLCLERGGTTRGRHRGCA